MPTFLAIAERSRGLLCGGSDGVLARSGQFGGALLLVVEGLQGLCGCLKARTEGRAVQEGEAGSYRFDQVGHLTSKLEVATGARNPPEFRARVAGEGTQVGE
jgi:hypothetical protein